MYLGVSAAQSRFFERSFDAVAPVHRAGELHATTLSQLASSVIDGYGGEAGLNVVRSVPNTFQDRQNLRDLLLELDLEPWSRQVDPDPAVARFAKLLDTCNRAIVSPAALRAHCEARRSSLVAAEHVAAPDRGRPEYWDFMHRIARAAEQIDVARRERGVWTRGAALWRLATLREEPSLREALLHRLGAASLVLVDDAHALSPAQAVLARELVTLATDAIVASRQRRFEVRVPWRASARGRDPHPATLPAPAHPAPQSPLPAPHTRRTGFGGPGLAPPLPSPRERRA